MIMELFDVYPLLPVSIDRGLGCHVWDVNGQEYLDCYGGHAVISVGHSHPKYVKAMQEQVAKLGFYSNAVINPMQKKLAEKLGKICGYPDYQLFLVNSGAEANENALKLASFHTGKSRVIAFTKAFHGRTSLAVETTDNPKIVAPINDSGHVTRIPWENIDRAKQEINKGDVAAVIMEGIQGVGGINIPSSNFLQELRQLCTDNGVLLIIDEIQSGYGRSGRFYAHQHAGIKADIVTMAKGIANGFPMGAMIITPEIKPVYGMLGTTFGGNHLACAGACAVLDIIREEKLMQNATRVGQYLRDELSKLPEVKEVRGLGLMIGVEYHEPVKEKRLNLLMNQHLFTGVSGTNIIRLLPPLCLSMHEAQDCVNRFKRV